MVATGQPLLFDDQLQHKLAYTGIVNPQDLPRTPAIVTLSNLVHVYDGQPPAAYDLQGLTLNGASLQIVGPVRLTLASGVTLNAAAGDAGRPEWLSLAIASGGVTLNGGATLSAFVTAPSGTVTLSGTLNGHVTSDRLTINGGGVLNTAP